MGLQDQILSISFQNGIETKVDLKQGVNGRLLSLTNAVFTGVTSLEKRFGYNPLPATVLATPTLPASTITVGNSLGIYNSALTLTDNLYFYSFSETENDWVNSGIHVIANVSSQSISQVVIANDPVAVMPYPSLVYNNSNIKFAVTPQPMVGGTIVGYTASYFDSLNNVLLETFNVATSITPSSSKTLSFSTFFVLLQGSTSNAQLTTFLQTPSTTSTVISTVASTKAPDMAASATNLYTLVFDGTNLVLRQYNTTMTLMNTATITPTAAVINLGITYDSINNELIIGYLYGGGGQISRYSPSTLALIAAVTTITDAGIVTGITQTASITFSTNGTDLCYFYDQFPNNNNFITSRSILAYRTSPTLTAASTYGYAMALYSKSFYFNGYFYVALSYTGGQPITVPDPQSGIYVVGTRGNVYTTPIRIAYNNTILYTQSSILYNSLVQWSNNALPYYNAVQPLLNTGFATGAEYNTNEANVVFSSKERNILLGKNLNLTGGSPFLYDGAGIAEQGFNTFPQVLSAAIQTGTGSSYAYTAVYTWLDFQGNIHRSAPSTPRVAVGNPISGTNSSLVSVSGLGLSEMYKAPTVQIELYRTEAGGTVFYLVQTLTNSKTAAVVFTDILTDALIVGNKQLYTTSGEVENIAPPPTRLITEFKNREVIVNAQDPLEWWFSKQVLQGFPVEFSDLLVQNIDEKGGPITAISTMDDKLVFFKNSTIWYVFGDGPAPNGQNNDFTYPQIVSSDTGCVNQDSIILTPIGLMFQSPKGIYLLDRGLNVAYIGSPVEAYNTSTVTSVAMIASTNQIRFTLNSGVALVYDYYVKQWSVFENVSAVDSTIYAGNFTYLTAAGIANRETPNAYLDNGAVIPMAFTTGWMKLSELQGFERLKKLLILGLSSGVSTISSLFNYDYNSTTTQSVSDIPVEANITRMQYRIFPPRQKGESFQYVYSEVPAAGSAGVTQVSNIALEIGIKKGPFKMPAGNSFG